MKKLTLLAAMLLAAGAVTAQAAEMILFDNPGLNGRQLTVRGYMPDINTFGFNDRASSVVVNSGTWEVCTDAQFRGFCATLQPGEYRMLDPRFNNRISSAREVGVSVVETAPPRLAEIVPAPYEPRGSIEMFAQTGYRGRTLTLDHNARNLHDLGFNDRATSLIVREGSWELCSDAGFRGTCRVFEPGSYADLGPGLAREISSARLVRSGNEPLYQTEVTPPPLQARPNIELFEGLNFDGHRFSTLRDAPSLDRRGFNDRAGSMIIYEGQWEACTDASYNGHCQVFGPGRYADLGRYNGEVSSVRRIH